jgi:acyl-CoA synthetase (AMP-forming)/AMP-acid ligase II
MRAPLHEYFQYHARTHGDLPMARDESRQLNFSQAFERTQKIANALQQRGLHKGDRIALLAKNSVDQLLVYLACSQLGIVTVGLNYRLAPAEWKFILDDADSKLLFADADLLPFIQPLIQAEGTTLPTICLHGELDGSTTLEALIAQQPATPCHTDVAMNDVLFQMYTSGTTGRPKGALLTHANVNANAFQAPLASGYFSAPGERFLNVAPMYHAAGLMSAFIVMMHGGELVIHRDFHPLNVVESLAKDRITGTTLVPVMLQFCLGFVPDIDKYDFSALKVINYGASPMAESLLKQAMAVFKCAFVQMYGQTEASSAVTCLTADDHRRALQDKPELLRSCGRAVVNTQIRIVDKAGNDVAMGESGEIIARGPQIMQGYWHRDDANADTLKDGWLHTGDAGKMDAEGYVYILDRVKDLIISGGENIYPAEIENVLLQHDAVQDGAVIGVPDPQWGEVALAVLIIKPGFSLDADALKAFCKLQLAGYKVPKHFIATEQLPRNPSGKILKKELRATYQPQYG